MKRRLLHTCDWQASRTRADRHRDWLGWTSAATSVAAMLVATTAIAMQLETNEGLKDATEDAIMIDMAPPAPSPPALAMSAASPDIPETEAPEAPELVEEMTEPPPEPMAEEEPLPEMEEIAEIPEVTPDEIALPDAPPPPPPTVKPRERPERTVEREPEPRREPRREAAAPAPSQQRQAAPSQAQGTSQQVVSAGQLQRLEVTWGNQIRSRIERRIRGGRDRGTVVVKLVVANSGGLISAGVAQSSGNPDLDSRVIQAVQSAARSFPAAPAGLTDASKTFTLPMTVN